MIHTFSCCFIVAFGQEYDDDELEAELADLDMEGHEDEQAQAQEMAACGVGVAHHMMANVATLGFLVCCT